MLLCCSLSGVWGSRGGLTGPVRTGGGVQEGGERGRLLSNDGGAGRRDDDKGDEELELGQLRLTRNKREGGHAGEQGSSLAHQDTHAVPTRKSVGRGPGSALRGERVDSAGDEKKEQNGSKSSMEEVGLWGGAVQAYAADWMRGAVRLRSAGAGGLGGGSDAVHLNGSHSCGTALEGTAAAAAQQGGGHSEVERSRSEGTSFVATATPQHTSDDGDAFGSPLSPRDQHPGKGGSL